jgi:hypothetical protein
MSKKEQLEGILMAYGMSELNRRYATQDILHLFGVIDSIYIDHCRNCDEFEKCWKDSKHQENCKKYCH